MPAGRPGRRRRGRQGAQAFRPAQWAIVNTRSAVDPFLTFADTARLREKVWRAFINRGDNGDANDNNATIAEIVKLRAERAKLLGYPTHAALADGGHDGQDARARRWS